MLHDTGPQPQAEGSRECGSILDEQARLARLVVHVSGLVRRGGRVEEQHGFRALVSMPRRREWLPNVFMSVLGVALHLATGDAVFLLAAGVALVGWHRKLVAGAERVWVTVRVDDLGRVSERTVDA